MENSFDYIIIGAGIEGSATAFELAKRGNKALLLDQFELGKSQGSSQGKSRIIRHSYIEDFFTRMTFEAYEEWFKIEKETGNKIYTKTGLLTLEKPPVNYLKQISNSLNKFNHPFEYLDSETIKTRFPSFNPNGCNGIYEADGGILKADVALKSIQDLFVKVGGYAKGNSKVIRIDPSADKVKINTENEEYEANSIIICCGPWAPDILKSLGLDLPIERQDVRVVYWKEKKEGTYNCDKFPCLIDETNAIYLLPSFEYPGHVKAGYHRRTQNETEIISQFIRNSFPELEPSAPSIEEKCYYTKTPDESFILDRHPKYKNIIIGTGFSGTGFKLAPVVGKILANLAEGKTEVYDLQPFRISRFNP